MVGSWRVAVPVRMLGDGGKVGIYGRDVPVSDDLDDDRVADKQVIDQLTLAAEDAGVALRAGYARSEVPQPLAITGVRLVEAAGPDLRSDKQDLRRGGRRFRR